MDDWFGMMCRGEELSSDAAVELQERGFVLIPGPVADAKLGRLVAAYDAAVASAHPEDVSVGSTTTRVSDFVNRGAEFDELYVFQPVLEACRQVIGRPFKLSTLHARTLRPHMPAQALHADFERDADGYPMVGFILMVDDFRSDNGATRFLPGSHNWPAVPDGFGDGRLAGYENTADACGPAGSLVVYNGSVRHGHGANLTGRPRRSLQGAYTRRGARSGGNLHARMKAETLTRISPLAKYLLDI